MKVTRIQAQQYATIFLRLALGISFLSAVADRFGWSGSYGQPNVAWGDFAHFTAYTGKLNAWAPTAMVPALAWTATAVETVLAILLVIGLFTRAAALVSGLTLLTFALAMSFALGVKAPLNFSVYSASAGAFLLATCRSYPFTLDHLIRPKHPH